MKNNIKALRTENKWSQEELGKRINVSRQAVNAIERDKHDPSLMLAFALSKVFDKTIEELFEP